MKIELHMLQNFAPSCLNRDDTNQPKTCDFGGVRRARISSQCLKRSIRHHAAFADELKPFSANRSVLVPQQVRDLLVSQYKFDAKLADELCAALVNLGKKGGGDEEAEPKKPKKGDKDKEAAAVELKMPQLVFFHRDEITQLAEALRGFAKEKPKDIVKALGRQDKLPKSCDIALFGRMVTSEYFLNADAACQVAHAISTHRVNVEMDFFTAVDDLQPEDQKGAGHLGTNEFSSACLYRFAVVDLDLLTKNLSHDKALAKKTLLAFCRAAVHAIPTGRQNTFATYELPSFVMAVVRTKGQPISLANAFVKPVDARQSGNIVEASTSALTQHWATLDAMYGVAKDAKIAVLSQYELPALLRNCSVPSLDKLITTVEAALS